MGGKRGRRGGRLSGDAAFRREWGFLFSRWVRYVLLAGVLALAFSVRVAPTEAVRLGMFQGVDEYWHLHVVNQMLRLGFRPAVDNQSWVPYGRPLVHPPIYHYMAYFLARVFSTDAFTVLFYIGPFIGVAACLGWFLLGRKLFGGWFEGLLAAGVYAVLPMTVASTGLGGARPQSLAEALLPYALAAFIQGFDGGVAYSVVSGLLLGVAALTWEASIYVFYPLAVLYWLARAAARQAERRHHLRAGAALATASAIAAAYYTPIYLEYGIWGNTPAWLLKDTATFWTPPSDTLLYGYLAGMHVFLVVSALALPALAWSVVRDRGRLPREVWGLTLFSIGFLGCFLSIGMRALAMTLDKGIVLTFTSASSKAYRGRALKSLRSRTLLAASLCALVGLSGAYTAYFTSTYFISWYEYKGLTGLRSLFNTVIPPNSTVICWYDDANYFLAHGLKTPWDTYLEHLPAWAVEQATKVVKIYLAGSEEEALELMRGFNATYILVRVEMVYPEFFSTLMEAVGLRGTPEEYFNLSPVIEKRPKLVMDPFTGQWVPSDVFENVVVGYEWAPQPKAVNTLLARLVWNNWTGRVLRQEVVPEPPKHFRLVWTDQERGVMLYEVVDS